MFALTAMSAPAELAFRRVILDVPEDDAPRLVYADWLDEHGEAARAEFIRVQCELARLPETCDTGCDGNPGGSSSGAQVGLCSLHELRADLRERELKLLTGPHHDWISPPESWKSVWGTPPGSDTLKIGWVNLTPATFGAVSLAFTRGFVDRVECTTAAFIGGPCGQCLYGGVPLMNNPNCPNCSGSGCTPGIAPALFAQQPVIQVVLTDREPYTSENTRGEFCWFRGQPQQRHPQSDLPEAIYDLLEGWAYEESQGEGYQHFKVWASSTAAHAALSLACVQYGRANAAGMTHRGPCPCLGLQHLDLTRNDPRTNAPKRRPARRHCSKCGGSAVADFPGLPPLPPPGRPRTEENVT